MSTEPTPEAAVILIVDDEDAPRRVLERVLTREGHRVLSAERAAQALQLLDEHDVDVIFTDLHMPDTTGLELLRAVKARSPETPVIVMTGFGSTDTAIEALREGAFDYLQKPLETDYLRHRLRQALNFTAMNREIRLLRRESTASDSLLGQSEAMRRVLDLVARVARNDITVLIQGETGTGKELVAREIHAHSRRARAPFVAINCGAVAHQLLESELFGHVKGAFTGADAARIGLFEAAHGGTIFLDEIGETPPDLQVRLLRVLEEREVLPVGSSKPRPVDVRIIAATHRNLAEAVDTGAFREDLFYRLNVVIIEAPPLRHRGEDIPLLAAHFLKDCQRRYQTQARAFSREALLHLVSHDWPGNIRELRNVVTRAAALHTDDVLGPDALPPTLVRRPVVTLDLDHNLVTLQELERRHIALVLQKTEGNKSDAAAILGIDRSTLYRKCKQFDLE